MVPSFWERMTQGRSAFVKVIFCRCQLPALVQVGTNRTGLLQRVLNYSDRLPHPSDKSWAGRAWLIALRSVTRRCAFWIRRSQSTQSLRTVPFNAPALLFRHSSNVRLMSMAQSGAQKSHSAPWTSVLVVHSTWFALSMKQWTTVFKAIGCR